MGEQAMTGTAYFDPLETQAPQQREERLLAALPRQVAHARERTAAYAQLLRDVEPGEVTSRTALSRLPVVRKHELMVAQQARRATDPFGGFAAIGWRAGGALGPARRVFQSPGGVYEPEGQASDYWRTARAIFAAGFRAGDLVHNSFSYHLTPAGAIMESGAHAVGCTVFPAGVGNTELQLQALVDLQADGYIGTPSFLRILVEKAESAHIRPGRLAKALVSGEAFPRPLHAWLRERGIEALQCYATADLGLIAYETAAREGLVLDEGVLVEIVRPGTGEPVPDGEVGEVVVTTFNPDYPLVRFGTGDLSALLPGTCPTGRTNARIKGWMGRADDAVKVRGMFVHPLHVADVLRRHPGLARARLLVSGEMANDQLTLEVEREDTGGDTELAARLADSMRDVTRLRADIRLCAVGALPADGKVIEDRRRLD
jgi:phenylacetate-CoA ligase